MINTNPKERILALRLAEKIQRDPEFAEKIGVNIDIRKPNELFDKNTNKDNK